MNIILAQRKRGERLDQFTFRFLDPRFQDPTPEGFFALPVVRAELADLRQDLRASSLAPDPGLNDLYGTSRP